jgi:hypothetical protein
MFKKATDEQILKWVNEKELNHFGKYLVSSSVHGKPGIPLAEISRLHKIIKNNFDEPQLFSLGKRLISRSEYTARRMGYSLIVNGWPNKEIESLLLDAANDEDWQVRETAAGVFSNLLSKDFKHFSKLFEKWIKAESENVKRAIIVAVKYNSQSDDDSRWQTYFKLLDPLMSEEAEYIRKNLGPFAIGDGLLSRFPKQTLMACEKWAKSQNENVKWNTAMIFTAAAARKHAKQGKQVLSILITDKNKFVSKAATKAMKNLD